MGIQKKLGYVLDILKTVGYEEPELSSRLIYFIDLLESRILKQLLERSPALRDLEDDRLKMKEYIDKQDLKSVEQSSAEFMKKISSAIPKEDFLELYQNTLNAQLSDYYLAIQTSLTKEQDMQIKQLVEMVAE